MTADSTLSQAFSRSYAEARQRFLAAASAAGLAALSHPHPLPGREGETLAMDVALDGPDDAERLLIVTSACHGVEGFCGSGVQVAALHDAAGRQAAKAQGVAVLHVHALNPHGFSHLRRTTHENVDLNRNFHDFAQPLPQNPAYAELHPLLLPAVWPPDAGNVAATGAWLAAHGPAAYQAAMTRGQHTHPDGVYFGGTAPTWSNTTFRGVLRQHAGRARRIAWIDLHTGLGPSGHGERIFAARDDAAALARARAWWGGGGATPVTSIYDGSSSSPFLTGLLFNAVYDECPQAEYTGIAMEYGTRPLQDVLDALRADHWLHNHPEAPAGQAAAIHRQMVDAFYVDSDAWRQQVHRQAQQAMQQAVHGLAGQPL